MTLQNKKQFGVWMDSRHATIAGRKNIDNGDFVIVGHVENNGADSNSNEKTAHNAQKGLQHKFFKEITAFMQNAEEVHITGTGTEQEQFIHYMAEIPQFKNTKAEENTSNKLSDEKLLVYIAERFN